MISHSHSVGLRGEFEPFEYVHDRRRSPPIRRSDPESRETDCVYLHWSTCDTPGQSCLGIESPDDREQSPHNGGTGGVQIGAPQTMHPDRLADGPERRARRSQTGLRGLRGDASQDRRSRRARVRPRDRGSRRRPTPGRRRQRREAESNAGASEGHLPVLRGTSARSPRPQSFACAFKFWLGCSQSAERERSSCIRNDRGSQECSWWPEPSVPASQSHSSRPPPARASRRLAARPRRSRPAPCFRIRSRRRATRCSTLRT